MMRTEASLKESRSVMKIMQRCREDEEVKSGEDFAGKLKMMNDLEELPRERVERSLLEAVRRLKLKWNSVRWMNWFLWYLLQTGYGMDFVLFAGLEFDGVRMKGKVSWSLVGLKDG
ncbi:unnamed protein product [Vicia faba]|uniref:Uncharacterized protein n=1 Tax=Vicia faba TaxID=3906 RepID=A0AAV0Z4C9_VICFA|nr:unnamed protein product [Vicia faba]